jgi:putative endonuclease
MATHNELGKKGEVLAAELLLKKGYTILEKNWRYLKAEVDIIAQNKETLVIVEVKTRSSDYFGDPQDFINPKKIQLLVSAANEYVVSRNLDVEVRFDIIAILLNSKTKKIEHLENAFLYF